MLVNGTRVDVSNYWVDYNTLTILCLIGTRWSILSSSGINYRYLQVVERNRAHTKEYTNQHSRASYTTQYAGKTLTKLLSKNICGDISPV